MAQNTSNAPPLRRVTIVVDEDVAKMALKVQDFKDKSLENETGGYGEIFILLEAGKVKRFKCADDYLVSRLPDIA